MIATPSGWLSCFKPGQQVDGVDAGHPCYVVNLVQPQFGDAGVAPLDLWLWHAEAAGQFGC